MQEGVNMPGLGGQDSGEMEGGTRYVMLCLLEGKEMGSGICCTVRCSAGQVRSV